jgi:hypothetical protein
MAADSNDANAMVPRWQFSLRELLFITVVVSLHLAAFAILFQYTEINKPRHNLRAALAGGIGGLIGVSIQAVIGRARAGPTVVKLRTQYTRTQSFGATLLAPTTVLATFVIFDRWLAVSIAESVVVGLLGGLIMSALLSGVVLLIRSTRLCDSGIVQDGLYYCPWSRIRSWSWNTNDGSRLMLGRGWRHWTVIVPPSQRAAVEMLLKEKLEQ